MVIEPVTEAKMARRLKIHLKECYLIMRTVLVLAVFTILTAQFGFGEAIEHPRNLKEEARVHEKAQKRWLWSAVALTAASFADVHSSWGKLEANGLLRSGNGTFGARGLGIKMGMVSGILFSQHLMVKQNPVLAKTLTWGNFGMAGLKLGVASRNYQIEKPAYLLRQQ